MAAILMSALYLQACDPLHRQYLLLPPIPGDVAALVAVQLLIERGGFADCFLVPSGDDEEADATEETSFRVIWLVVLENKPVALVFSSHTGQWRAITPLVWSLPGLQLSTWKYWFVSHHYAHGCIYWISGSIENCSCLTSGGWSSPWLITHPVPDIWAMMWPSRREAKAGL